MWYPLRGKSAIQQTNSIGSNSRKEYIAKQEKHKYKITILYSALWLRLVKGAANECSRIPDDLRHRRSSAECGLSQLQA